MKSFEIVYSDNSVIVCVKPAGVICEATEGKENMIDMVSNATKKHENDTPYVGLVHRLDQVTAGLMVFSADPKMTGKLSEAVMNKDTVKEYLAVVHGQPDEAVGEMLDLLYRDPKKNKSYVVKRSRKGVREAKLSYSTVATTEGKYGKVSLVRIQLQTGRTHQIRVQFASRGMPLVGDGKYGAADNAPSVALLSHRISFTHPKSGKRMEFITDMPDGEPWDEFK